MAGEADIWQPRTIVEVTAGTKTVTERFTAIQDQQLFVLTDFAYAVGTGALQVYKNGAYLAPGADFTEQTDTSFSITAACNAGDQIVAVGNVGISGTVDVRDTDIFLTNYQNLRDYAGIEDNIYVQGNTTKGDGGESFYQLHTGAAPGTYIDDDNEIIVPTGGDGSSAWLRSSVPYTSSGVGAVSMDMQTKLRLTDSRFPTIAAAQAVIATIGIGDTIYIEERGAYFKCVAYTAPNGWDIVSGNGTKVFQIVPTVEITPMSLGYDSNATNMTTPAIVSANWDAMKRYIAFMSENHLEVPHGETILTMQQIFANWISGTQTPLGFYSDSTTDGFRTTGHVPSTYTDSPFEVTINESPNAYPKILQQLAAVVGPAKTNADCWNGGFDSQSYIQGDLFGLKHWYNVWFRAAGSNKSWTSVKAIVLGFGTSDSANIDDTATVIEDYGIAVECNIIDCFLRGVQPILQTPVTTTQHLGNTINGRNGDQSLTIINSVLSNLAAKYNLELLTYGQPQIDILNSFSSINYSDLFNAATSDQVHPLDYGHRIHAGYLMAHMNNQVPKVNDKILNIFPGSPYFKITDESINTFTLITDTPPSILLRAVTDYGSAVLAYNEFFYRFPVTTAADTTLLETSFHVDEPSMLLYQPIDSSAVGPSFLINHVPTNDNVTVPSDAVMQQPFDRTYTKMHILSNLRYGMNTVYIKSNAAGGIQDIGGLMVVPISKMGDISYLRQSLGGTLRTNRVFRLEIILMLITQPIMRHNMPRRGCGTIQLIMLTVRLRSH